jgi:hypothetical protein
MAGMAARRFLIAALLLLLVVTPSWAGTHFDGAPWVAELERFATRYHEDPPRLDKIRGGLVEAVKTDPRPENLVALARALLESMKGKS